jgi:hypothetical protein
MQEAETACGMWNTFGSDKLFQSPRVCEASFSEVKVGLPPPQTVSNILRKKMTA